MRGWIVATHGLALLLAVCVASPQEPPGPGPDDLEVTQVDGLVTLTARSVPISRVLSELGRETGVEIVYMDDRPMDEVSAELRDVGVAEAVARLLDGLGLGYALKLSPDTSGVEMVLISGRDTSPRASPAAGGEAEVVESAADWPSPQDPGGEWPEESLEPEIEDSEAGEDKDDPDGPPRPPGTLLPSGLSPPLPERPADLPTSPFVPYPGPLNPGASPGEAGSDPTTAPEPTDPGEVIEMDGMGTLGPTTEPKTRVPEEHPEPLPPGPPPSSSS